MDAQSSKTTHGSSDMNESDLLIDLAKTKEIPQPLVLREQMQSCFVMPGSLETKEKRNSSPARILCPLVPVQLLQPPPTWQPLENRNKYSLDCNAVDAQSLNATPGPSNTNESDLTIIAEAEKVPQLQILREQKQDYWVFMMDSPETTENGNSLRACTPCPVAPGICPEPSSAMWLPQGSQLAALPECNTVEAQSSKTTLGKTDRNGLLNAEMEELSQLLVLQEQNQNSLFLMPNSLKTKDKRGSLPARIPCPLVQGAPAEPPSSTRQSPRSQHDDSPERRPNKAKTREELALLEDKQVSRFLLPGAPKRKKGKRGLSPACIPFPLVSGTPQKRPRPTRQSRSSEDEDSPDRNKAAARPFKTRCDLSRSGESDTNGPRQPRKVKPKEDFAMLEEKQVSRFLLPDAPKREKKRDSSPTRVSPTRLPCLLVPGTPAVPPPPTRQPWKKQVKEASKRKAAVSRSLKKRPEPDKSDTNESDPLKEAESEDTPLSTLQEKKLESWCSKPDPLKTKKKRKSCGGRAPAPCPPAAGTPPEPSPLPWLPRGLEDEDSIVSGSDRLKQAIQNFYKNQRPASQVSRFLMPNASKRSKSCGERAPAPCPPAAGAPPEPSPLPWLPRGLEDVDSIVSGSDRLKQAIQNFYKNPASQAVDEQKQVSRFLMPNAPKRKNNRDTPSPPRVACPLASGTPSTPPLPKPRTAPKKKRRKNLLKCSQLKEAKTKDVAPQLLKVKKESKTSLLDAPETKDKRNSSSARTPSPLVSDTSEPPCDDEDSGSENEDSESKNDDLLVPKCSTTAAEYIRDRPRKRGYPRFEEQKDKTDEIPHELAALLAYKKVYVKKILMSDTPEINKERRGTPGEHERNVLQKFYSILESHTFLTENYAALQNLWFKAHFREAEIIRGKPIGKDAQYRIKRKYPLPESICNQNHLKENREKELRAYFSKNPTPTTAQKRALGKGVGLSLSQINDWFRRYRQKLQADQRNSTPTSKPCTTPKSRPSKPQASKWRPKFNYPEPGLSEFGQQEANTKEIPEPMKANQVKFLIPSAPETKKLRSSSPARMPYPLVPGTALEPPPTWLPRGSQHKDSPDLSSMGASPSKIHRFPIRIRRPNRNRASSLYLSKPAPSHTNGPMPNESNTEGQGGQGDGGHLLQVEYIGFTPKSTTEEYIIPNSVTMDPGYRQETNVSEGDIELVLKTEDSGSDADVDDSVSETTHERNECPAYRQPDLPPSPIDSGSGQENVFVDDVEQYIEWVPIIEDPGSDTDTASDSETTQRNKWSDIQSNLSPDTVNPLEEVDAVGDSALREITSSPIMDSESGSPSRQETNVSDGDIELVLKTEDSGSDTEVYESVSETIHERRHKTASPIMDSGSGSPSRQETNVSDDDMEWKSITGETGSDTDVDDSDCETTYGNNKRPAYIEPGLLPDALKLLEEMDACDDSALREIISCSDDMLQFDWSDDRNFFTGKQETFTGRPGPTFDTHGMSPLEIFQKIWDDSIIDLIVRETNEYGRRSTLKKNLDPKCAVTWTDINEVDLWSFFAVIMLQSIVPILVEKEYWYPCLPDLKLGDFKGIMSYQKYVKIKKSLRFADSKKEEGKNKILHMISPIFDHLNNKFSSLYLPEQNIAINESQMLWKGRLSAKNENKTVRIGVESYDLCESHTGYTWKTITRDVEERSNEQKDATSKIVYNLMRPLLHKGHTLVMNNTYNSPLLSRALKRQKTDTLGTLRLNREFAPESLRNATRSNTRAGDIVCSQTRDLSVIVWHDALGNLVSMISTFHKAEIGEKEQPNIYKYKPKVALDYNNFIGGVGKRDQVLKAFPMDRIRHVVWYMKLFRRLFNVSIYNAFVVYNHGKNETQRQFRVSLVDEILKKIITQKLKQTMSIKEEHLRIKRKSGRVLCKWCSRNKVNRYTWWECGTCQISLCLVDCFKQYHISLSPDQ